MDRTPNWVWVLCHTGSVRVDSEPFAMDVEVAGSTFRFEGGDALLTPDLFCIWLASEFDYQISIECWEWEELLDHWFEMSEDAVLVSEPIVTVPITQGILDRLVMGDKEVFLEMCKAIAEVAGGRCWVEFAVLPSHTGRLLNG